MDIYGINHIHEIWVNNSCLFRRSQFKITIIQLYMCMLFYVNVIFKRLRDHDHKNIDFSGCRKILENVKFYLPRGANNRILPNLLDLPSFLIVAHLQLVRSSSFVF